MEIDARGSEKSLSFCCLKIDNVFCVSRLTREDIGCFITSSKYSFDEAIDIIKEYFNGKPTDKQLRHYIAYIAVSSFYWFLWAINQEIQGKSIGEYLYIWYNHTKEYADYALKLYEQE